MCGGTNWKSLLRYKTVNIVSNILAFNMLKKYYGNIITSANANFTIITTNFQIGGQYQIVIVKTTALPITVNLPASSVISGTSDNVFTLTGEIGTKYLCEFTNDGTNYIWKQVVSSSSSSTTPLLNIIDITNNYTPTLADNGKVLRCITESGFNVIFSNDLPLGFYVSIIQIGSAKITCTAGASATLLEPDSQYKTNGKDSTIAALVSEKTSTTTVTISGNTSA